MSIFELGELIEDFCENKKQNIKNIILTDNVTLVFNENPKKIVIKEKVKIRGVLKNLEIISWNNLKKKDLFVDVINYIQNNLI
jgi:hypothetical protein